MRRGLDTHITSITRVSYGQLSRTFASPMLSSLNQNLALSIRRCVLSTGIQKYVRTISSVPTLDSIDTGTFQEQAWKPCLPHRIRLAGQDLPRALTRWFQTTSDGQTLMRSSFWAQHALMIVPLEITSQNECGANDSFERIEAPLAVLLEDLRQDNVSKHKRKSIYMAQYDLRDLPRDFHADLPMPSLIHTVGKGDLYSSSLWLGRSPTYTPLHHDANPNLFMQLAGKKTIRLLPPNIGTALLNHVNQIHASSFQDPRTTMRGIQMMVGPESEMLHDLVWSMGKDTPQVLVDSVQEITLEAGDMIFVPERWWHSVKGIGQGVNGSANWWFR